MCHENQYSEILLSQSPYQIFIFFLILKKTFLRICFKAFIIIHTFSNWSLINNLRIITYIKMYYLQPSPSRSMKSGNSTSSSNSTRSYGGSKTFASNDKVQSAKSSQQNSFDEEDNGPVPEGLVRCALCKRNFAEDRIEKHQVICQKTKTKKRKIFDSSKKRVQVSC